MLRHNALDLGRLRRFGCWMELLDERCIVFGHLQSLRAHSQEWLCQPEPALIVALVDGDRESNDIRKSIEKSRKIRHGEAPSAQIDGRRSARRIVALCRPRFLVDFSLGLKPPLSLTPQQRRDSIALQLPIPVSPRTTQLESACGYSSWSSGLPSVPT